ncbi:MAG TPA: exodeoxyribonuclease VII small subunit [Prevotellaceae bacterium]|nr:exodeoxyribonuclease VII small subunit [Prevotellaceae bacterium]
MEKQKLTYAQAQQRLEQIVKDIEENPGDIDRLSSLLKEAKELIAFCKKKLYRVEEDVRKVMDENMEA